MRNPLFSRAHGARTFRIVGLAFSFVGPLVLLGGIAHGGYTLIYRSTASRATGVIVGMMERPGSKGSTVYAPVFAFTDASAVRHEVESAWASYPPRHAVGDAIEVLYEPSAPQKAILDSFWSLWGPTVILAALGVGHLLLGLVLYRIGKALGEVSSQPARARAEINPK